MSRIDLDTSITDPQLRVYYEHPERYASVADSVALCMRLSDRGCAGGECDLGAPCRRHRLVAATVARYRRIRARRAVSR